MQPPKANDAQEKIRRAAQMEVYKSMAERKEAGVTALKGWDATSRKNLDAMKLTIDGMYERLKELVDDSDFRQDKVIRFFSAIKVSSASEFSLKEHLPRFTLGPTRLDPKTKTKVPLDAAQAAFGSYLESVERELGAFQTSLNAFQKQIEANIVGKILVERTREFEAKLKEMSGRRKQVKERIRKLQAATKSSFDELLRQLFMSLGETNRVKRPAVNVFQYVFTFVNNVRKLSMEVREFGFAFVEIFKAAKLLERERLASQRDAFVEFNGALERTFASTGLQGLKASEMGLRKISQGVWNADHFEPKDVLTSEQADVVRQRLGAAELTVDGLREYVAKERLEENIKELFDHFVMRRFLVRDADPRQAATHDVIVYMTVDYYYSIYQFNKTTRKHTVLANVPIELVKLVTKDATKVVFTFEEAGFLWNSRKKVALDFGKNEREELITDHENYVGLLTIGQATPDLHTEGASKAPGHKPRTTVSPPDPAPTPTPTTTQPQPEPKPNPAPSKPSQKEAVEVEDKALGFSQAPGPEPTTTATERNEPPLESFGTDTKMDEWEIE